MNGVVRASVCSGMQIHDVRSNDGVEGFIQYLFQNGDVAINSDTRGIQIRPESSLVNSHSSRRLN